MDHDDGVAPGRDLEGLGRLITCNGEPTLDEGFGPVLRPSCRRDEDKAASGTVVVAEASDMNLKSAKGLARDRGGIVAARITLSRGLRNCCEAEEQNRDKGQSDGSARAHKD